MPQLFNTVAYMSLHKVIHDDSAIVQICIHIQTTGALCQTLRERISNHTIASLKPNARLEGRLINSANHLQRNIRTIEDTRIKGARTTIADGGIVTADSIRIDVDLKATIQHTGEGVTGIRSEEHTSELQSH